jgi:hypothetical protein
MLLPSSPQHQTGLQIPSRGLLYHGSELPPHGVLPGHRGAHLSSGGETLDTDHARGMFKPEDCLARHDFDRIGLGPSRTMATSDSTLATPSRVLPEDLTSCIVCGRIQVRGYEPIDDMQWLTRDCSAIVVTVGQTILIEHLDNDFQKDFTCTYIRYERVSCLLQRDTDGTQ